MSAIKRKGEFVVEYENNHTASRVWQLLGDKRLTTDENVSLKISGPLPDSGVVGQAITTIIDNGTETNSVVVAPESVWLKPGLFANRNLEDQLMGSTAASLRYLSDCDANNVVHFGKMTSEQSLPAHMLPLFEEMSPADQVRITERLARLGRLHNLDQKVSKISSMPRVLAMTERSIQYWLMTAATFMRQDSIEYYDENGHFAVAKLTFKIAIARWEFVSEMLKETRRDIRLPQRKRWVNR